MKITLYSINNRLEWNLDSNSAGDFLRVSRKQKEPTPPWKIQIEIEQLTLTRQNIFKMGRIRIYEKDF